MELFFCIHPIHLLTHITNDNNTQSCAYDIFIYWEVLMLQFCRGYGNLYRYTEKLYYRGGFFLSYAKRTIQIIHKIQNTTPVKYIVVCCYPTSSCLLTANALLYLPKYPQMYIRRNSFFMQVDTMPSRIFFLYPLTLIHWDFFYAKYRFVNSTYCVLGMSFTMLEYILLFCLNNVCFVYDITFVFLVYGYSTVNLKRFFLLIYLRFLWM